MIPQFVYGDSYGGVAQNSLALDAGRDSRYFQSLADQRSRERAASAANLAQQGLDQQRALAQAQMAQAFQLDQQRGQDRHAELAQQADQFNRNLDASFLLQKMKEAPIADRLTMRDRFQVRNQTATDIDRGVIRTPDALDSYVGGVLPEDDMNRLRLQLNEQHNRLLTAFGQQQKLADNYNAQWGQQVGPLKTAADLIQSQRAAEVAAAPSDSQMHGWLGYFRPEIQAHPFKPWTYGTTKESLQANPVAQLAPVRMFNQADEEFQKNLLKDKRAQSQLTQDAATHQFVPVMPQPEAWGSPTNSGSATVIPPLSAAPSTQVAPLAAPAPAAPSLDSWVPLTKGGQPTGQLIHPAAWSNIQAQLAALPGDPQDDNHKIAAQNLFKQAMAAGQVTNLNSAVQ